MLGISEEIRKAIEELGFEHPTPVQEEVIPYLLGEGNDVIALAQTGTGKTAAYGLPLIQKVNPQQKHTQALILSPTRELCLQISDSLSDFSKYIKGLTVVPVYGGTSIETQIKALKKGTQIIVATPGRLIDLIHRGVAKLENVTNVVLDEADEMLNMGFSESRNEGAESVNHIYYMVNAKDKYLALKRIVDYYPSIFAIIFCRTKRETQEIADKLIHDGYNAEALHGDLSQQQRDLTMQKFRKHTTQFLVATDVAARGLDVDDLTHVINFGLPDDIESYTHRSGRTGRAGKKGTSISIIHTRERSKMHAIEKVISKAFVEGEIPDAKAICSKQLYKVMDQILKADVNEEEIAPFLSEINRHFEYVDKEDIIKKIVSMEFGKFLEYYANAPVIEKPSRGRGEDRGSKGNRRDGNGQRRGGERRAPRAVESGFKRLFINLGKADGFYPGEIMQFINKNVKGRQQVGHIDLLDKISYIEVPERDANKVMKALSGSIYKNREVRCNDAEEGSNGRKGRSTGGRNAGGDSDNRYEKRSRQRNSNGERRQGGRNSKGYYTERGEESGDWRQFFNDKKVNLRGEEPDFSEDGWARRKPRKK